MNEIGPLKVKIKGYIDEIMSFNGIVACAIVTTEGQIIGKSESERAPSSFLGITAATMYASSEAACSTFHISRPECVQVDTLNGDGRILIKSSGRKILIATVINDSADINEVRKMLIPISEKVGENL
ncbi:roadblock/LC7 domain-containing protein [Methanoplanus endosymbiosus]|uniref:Roadblock/LC7 domain-containing protein n=1 Tax=Methanoplanus endosymbiosus TaxID=33865 RepID=A0A9E7PPW7_9EURY|nr:roadblock/LC7 domain-containing protein [Methanoplanus endosymbiosus]UUX92846.1 roadblock/LC7 domain-containing protein [Methanoplanus endosymbiosus]